MVEPWTAHKRALKAHMWAEAQRVKVTVPFLNKHTEDCRYTHLSTQSLHAQKKRKINRAVLILYMRTYLRAPRKQYMTFEV